MARTRKADILSRGQRHREGIPGRDVPPPIDTPEWREYYRRLNVRAEKEITVRIKAGWSSAPTYFHSRLFSNSNKQER